MRPISSHLDQTNLVNKRFSIWLSGKFFLRATAGSPVQARCLHLARSGSQSHRVIWFILPTRRASRIIRNIYLVFSLLWNSAVLFYIQYITVQKWYNLLGLHYQTSKFLLHISQNLLTTLFVSPCMVLKSSLKWS